MEGKNRTILDHGIIKLEVSTLQMSHNVTPQAVISIYGLLKRWLDS